MVNLTDANIVIERPSEMDYETYKFYRNLQNKELKKRIKNGLAFIPSNYYAKFKSKNK